MEASVDRMEDVEMPAAALDSEGDGEQAAPPAASEDAEMAACEQPAAPDVDADADMVAGVQSAFEGITVATTPPESATGVTAYFLFANVHREQAKAALLAELPESAKVTIGMVGKKIGELWKQCTDEVKQAYSEKAKVPVMQNKEQAKKDAAAGGGEGDGDPKKNAPMSLPKSVVKKIVMLDEDQTRIAGDAVELLTKASEMFLSSLTTRSHDEAKGAARSTVNFRDIESVLRRWRPTAWQSSPFAELEKDAPAAQAQNKGMTEAAQKTRSITSFFQQAT